MTDSLHVHTLSWGKRALKCVKRDQSSKLHFLRLDKLNAGEWCCILYWNVQVLGWLVRCNIWILWILHGAYCICTCPAASLFSSIHFLLHFQVCLTRSDNRFSRVIQTTFDQHVLPLFLGDLKKTKQRKTSIYGMHYLCNLFDHIGLLHGSSSSSASLLLLRSACSPAVSSLPCCLWLLLWHKHLK